MSRAKSITLLVVSSTLIALGAAELLARFIGIRPMFGQLVFVRGAATRSVDGVPLWSDDAPRYDGEDLRRASSDASAFTIVGLGDSIMYGVSVAKEETYLEQARHMLASQSKRPVEILNLATPGYNTMQEDAVHKEIDDQIKPGLVIVHYWIDDVHQYRAVGGYVVDFGDVSEDGHLVVRALPLPARLSDFLLVHSRLYDLLTQAVLALNHEVKQTDWTRVSTPLADIHARAQRAGGRLVVLASPDLTGATPTSNPDLRTLREFASTRGIEVIDLSEWLRDVDTRRIALDSCHFNPEGHRLVGERLAEYLLKHDLQDWQR